MDLEQQDQKEEKEQEQQIDKKEEPEEIMPLKNAIVRGGNIPPHHEYSDTTENSNIFQAFIFKLFISILLSLSNFIILFGQIKIVFF